MNPENPLVSVIIPNYNHARFLADRIHSILDQTFNNFELIILDDASTDRSVELIKELLADRPYQLIVNSQNSGSPCSQWLSGIRIAKGEFIWIAESDDAADSTFLESMVSHLTPAVCMVYCRTIEINEAGTKSSSYFWPDLFAPGRWLRDFSSPAFSELQNYMTRLNIIPNASCVVFRKSCVREMPAFDHMRYMGDWLFWATLMAHSPQSTIVFLASTLVMHRSHTSSTRQPTSSFSAETKRFQEYSMAINQVLRLSCVSWGKILQLCLDNYWGWSYEFYLSQRADFSGQRHGLPPFRGIHFIGYVVYRLRLGQLRNLCNTRMALLKHRLKSNLLPLARK